MKNHLIFLTALLLVNLLMGQGSVTFQVNLEDLNRLGLFSSDSGDRVVLRGSFNDWTSTNYELNKLPHSYIYSGTFSFENVGDTIAYKYVIVNVQNQAIWEVNPNPYNADHGNRLLVVEENTLVLPPVEFRYDEYIRYPVVFSKEKLQEDFKQFRNILESTHPALYDYTAKETLDSLFESNFNKIETELEFSKFLMLLTEVISKVGCGHSSLWIPGKFWSIAPAQLFPLKLFGSGNKIFATGSYTDNDEVPIGSEIVAINGQSVQEVVDRLASLTSADGFNPSYRRTKVLQNFSVKYALAYGFFPEFAVLYQAPGVHEQTRKLIQPVSKYVVDQNKPKRNELSFKIQEESTIGVLTINTFGYYGQVEMFHNFVDSVFNEINQNGVQNLILDLRGNSGGDPFCASYLWAYLQPEPSPYFIDRYGKYDTLANPISMPRNSFKGKLYTLIDGNGFSTTGHFCGLLKYHKVGLFIGSELGSTYTCTGNATYPPLRNTGIMVGTAKVRRYTTAVTGMDPTRGIIPDYPVEPSQNDLIQGKDAVMQFAFTLIRSE